jgi:site-specific DNA-methyltransferase (adenine-specific)
VANTLYFGDNLDWMRKLPSESIDLIYLDPPFNSKAEYNKVWRGPTGQAPRATVQTFEDTWTWNETSREAFDDVMGQGGHLAGFLQAMRGVLNDNDIMAYMAMMAVRMTEFRRVLKSTGSIYLHCDPTASHYLKLLMDLVFGHQNFRDEIVWQRTNAHNFKSKIYPRVHDVILFYTASSVYTYNQQFGGFSDQQIARYETEPGTNRQFTGQDMTIIGGDMTPWRGTAPNGNRGWGLGLPERERLWSAGLILKRKDGSPRLDGRKVYLDEKKGVPIADVWTDIKRIPNTSGEREGYATQKPQALLERIIATSSNPGDMILDPFCGCGTAVHAAQAMGRKWIGIDITHVAIEVVERRLRRAFGPGHCNTEGRPRDTEGAQVLAERNRYQFQWWATSMIGAHPYGGYKKGADGGIDGIAYFKTGKRTSGFAIVQVKSDKKLSRDVIDKLHGVMHARMADIGILVCLAQPTDPMKKEVVNAGKVSFEDEEYPRIQILTVDEIFAKKRLRLPPLYKDLPDSSEGRAPIAPVISPEELRRSPRLKLPIPGGKSISKQGALPIEEPVLTNSQTRSPTKRRA